MPNPRRTFGGSAKDRHLNTGLRDELLELQRVDLETRARLAQEGTLWAGYAPEMERVHCDNAARLEAILDRHGWPGRSLVGAEGAEAVWMLAQHAIGDPTLQRRCLALLREAVALGDAPPRHEAYLTDRIRFNERRPQVYGTVVDWDEHGKLSPWRMEGAATVDARRGAVGLPPLAHVVETMRQEAAAEGQDPPRDYEARQLEIEAWARRAGWIDTTDTA